MNDKLDRIAAQLRRTEPYLPDNGFAAAVVAQLPRGRALPVWEKNLVLLLATALGSAIAATQIPFSAALGALQNLLPQFLTSYGQAATSAMMPIAAFVVGIAIMYTVSFSLVWTVRRELL
jgi:hypothetical protein